MGNFLYDTRNAWKYSLRTAEIGARIGDIQTLLLGVENYGSEIIAQGQLKSVEAKQADILKKSTATELQIENFLGFTRNSLLFPRGEWIKALDWNRAHLERLHRRAYLQGITLGNSRLATTIVELNRFGEPCDLAEAEAALQENIKLGFTGDTPRFLMAVLACRKGNLTEAHERLAEAIAVVPVCPDSIVLRLRDEAELARVEGHWDAAINTIEKLLEYDQNGGFVWNQARRMIDLGDCLMSRNSPGDKERAREVYQQSLEMFTEMDAPGYIRVLEERLGDL